MDDSLTNAPPEKTAAPTPPPSAGESEKPPENVASIIQASTPASTVRRSIAPDQSTTAQIFEWITSAIVAKANLPQHLAELAAFWIISSWFPQALTLFPLLVVTGPTHDAMVLLSILKDLCCRAGLVAEFKRDDIKDLNFSFDTVLISAPN